MSDPVSDAAAAVAARLLAEHPADRPRSRADLDALPAPVARRVRAALDRRADEAAALPVTPWVDADDAEVEAAARAWHAATRAAARVPGGAWAETLRAAVEEALAHLVRPAPTLAAWAFRDEPEDGGDLPTGMAIERTRAFGAFRYLPEIAARYADRKGAERIDRAGLERLFGQIDRRMTEPFGADEWAALLGPLFDVAGGAVSAAVVREALSVRGADALVPSFAGDDAVTPDELRARVAEALDAAPPVTAAPDETATPDETADEPAAPESETPGGADDTGPSDDGGGAETPDVPPPAPPVIGSRWEDPEDAISDDSAVLGGTRPAAPPPEPAAAQEPVAAPSLEEESAPPVADLAALPTSDPDLADDFPADGSTGAGVEDKPAPPTEDAGGAGGVDADEPLWRRIARRQGVEVIESDAGEPESRTGPAPLWQRFAQPGGAPPARPAAAPAPPSGSLDDVERRVLGDGPDDRRATFVADLFGGSTDDYHRTLLALDGARTWTEATQVIARDVFQKHRVNIYSDPAVAFTDAVEARIGQR